MCHHPPWLFPVESLADEQLIEELEAASTAAEVEMNRANLLLATAPDPFYVLTSSHTTTSGSARGNVSAYIIPTGYGTQVSPRTRGSGLVANTTSAINGEVSGLWIDNQITIQFSGGGLGGQALGTAALLR